MLHLRYRIAAPVYAIHYTYKQGSSQYLTQATFVVCDTGIENSDKGKSLAPCDNLLSSTHSLTHSLPITPHIVRQRGVPVTFELTSAPNSSLTEAFLPHILASLKCALLDKVKISFSLCMLAYRTYSDTEKGGFRLGDAGRSGGLFRLKKGKNPFSNP